MNIKTESNDTTKKDWKQPQMMFEGKDCQTLQTLINKGTITLEDQKTPIGALDAMKTTIKEEEHFLELEMKFYWIYNRNQTKVYIFLLTLSPHPSKMLNSHNQKPSKH